MNYLFRTQDINSLINEKGVAFFTKDSISEMAQVSVAGMLNCEL